MAAATAGRRTVRALRDSPPTAHHRRPPSQRWSGATARCAPWSGHRRGARALVYDLPSLMPIRARPRAAPSTECSGAIALECNADMLNAAHFHKGCYVGQEIMARTHFKVRSRARVRPSGAHPRPRVAQGLVRKRAVPVLFAPRGSAALEAMAALRDATQLLTPSGDLNLEHPALQASVTHLLPADTRALSLAEEGAQRGSKLMGLVPGACRPAALPFRSRRLSAPRPPGTNLGLAMLRLPDPLPADGLPLLRCRVSGGGVSAASEDDDAPSVETDVIAKPLLPPWWPPASRE